MPIDCLGDLEARLRELGDSVAAVLVEPMLQAAGGMIVWPSEFLAGVRRLCDRYGTLLIADEVLTGFGRTGKMFACEHAGDHARTSSASRRPSRPGYLPMGVDRRTSADLRAFFSEDRTKTFFHGHSYTANALACAVALASLDLFREESTLDRVAALEGWLRAGLEPLRSWTRRRCARDRRRGRLWRCAPRSRISQRIRARVCAALLERGLLLRPLGNVLYFMPPYAITQEETSWAISNRSPTCWTASLYRRLGASFSPL